MAAPDEQRQVSDLGNDWMLLVNALAQPVRQLIAVEAQDSAQMREVEQRLPGLAGSRPVLHQSVRPGAESPEELWRRVRGQIKDLGAAEAASIPLLIVGAPAWSEEANERAQLVEFWRGMNQLRERWHDLPVQVVFLLSPIAYEHLTRNADHLKRWIALKVHLGATTTDLNELLRPGREFGRVVGVGDEAERAQAALLARRRRGLDLLARQAREAQRRGEGPAELARRYYLPLAAGFLALGELEQAQRWRSLVADPAALAPEELPGVARLDERLADLRRRQSGGADAARFDFDVFLSHNSRDRPAVRALAQGLRAKGIRVWLDEEQLGPGMLWQSMLESGIRASQSMAVLIGADGLGPWQNEEVQTALTLAVRDGRPVIPVLLPDAPKVPELPPSLANRVWVDLRPAAGDASALDRLVWGITGRRSGR